MEQESKYIIIDKFKGVDFSNEDAAIIPRVHLCCKYNNLTLRATAVENGD